MGGYGVVWKEVQKHTEATLLTLRIDKRKRLPGVYLQGDNAKFLPSIDIHQFDLIDLDAYGTPYEQTKYILESGFRGPIFITFIQTVMGMLPKQMLYDLGYSLEMVEKCPTLFCRDPFEKFKRWLSLQGVEAIHYYGSGRKHYIALNV